MVFNKICKSRWIELKKNEQSSLIFYQLLTPSPAIETSCKLTKKWLLIYHGWERPLPWKYFTLWPDYSVSSILSFWLWSWSIFMSQWHTFSTRWCNLNVNIKQPMSKKSSTHIVGLLHDLCYKINVCVERRDRKLI